MEGFNVYKDIQDRTGGEIYIGVVGPVRTGKSTFIKKFMDTVVIPHIPDGMQRERAIDELPPILSGTHHYDHRAQVHPGTGCGRPN